MNWFTLSKNWTKLEKPFQKFNQDWWTEHNREFKQGRENFIKNILETKYPDEPDKSTLSADEMSQFYRYLPFKTSHWSCSPPYFLNISGSSWIVSGRAMLSTIRSGRRETGPLFFSQPEWSYRGSWTEDDDGLKSIILQIMTSRALRLLATNKWIRPLNATLALPSTSGLVRLEPYSFLPARRTLVTSTWLQNSLSDEDEVILLVGTTKNESRMRYKQTQFRIKICRCHFQV